MMEHQAQPRLLFTPAQVALVGFLGTPFAAMMGIGWLGFGALVFLLVSMQVFTLS